MLDGPTLSQLKRFQPLGDVICAGFPELHWSTGQSEIAGAPKLLSSLGMRSMLTIDVIQSEADILHDLNHPMRVKHWETCDTLLDCGTIEHVANVNQCLLNYCQLLRVGGRLVVSTVYNNFGGHGYWQLTPQFFFDFLNANGFKGVSVWTYSPFLFKPTAVDMAKTQSWTFDTPKLLLVTAVKQSATSEPVWPMQRFWSTPYRRQGGIRSLVRKALCKVAKEVLAVR